MRTACLVVATLAACSSAPSAAPSQPAQTPKKPAPSSECIRKAKAGADLMVDHVAQDPHGVWSMVHGKPEYGAPTKLSEDDFVAFLPTREGREWICGIKDFCASYYYGILNHCEAERSNQASRPIGP
jgi:hypothetical protein